jgi:hypothetical protein
MMQEIKQIISVEVFNHSKNKSDKLSFDFCKKILNIGTKIYTDDDVKLIVDYLYILAEININYYKTKSAKIIEFPEQKNNINDEQESHSLYPSKYRRTG